MAKRKDPCVHCGKKKGDRPRGLCWLCYVLKDPFGHLIRERYEELPRRGGARVSYIGIQGDGNVLPIPTNAYPGTPEKVEVLAIRARLGQSLWHPDDAPNHTRKTNRLDDR